MNDQTKSKIADIFEAVGGLIGLAFICVCVWYLYCGIMPPKIYGLCGVSLGEKWNGESHAFMNSTVPDVSCLDDSELVYKIQVGVEDADIDEVVGLVKEKYGITPSVRQFSDTKEDYRYFKDNRSNRAILVWSGTVYENKNGFDANWTSGMPVEKGAGVWIRAVDYSLEAKVEEEARRKKMRGL